MIKHILFINSKAIHFGNAFFPFLLLYSVILFYNPLVQAQDYYVDASLGVDTNIGSQQSPFQTLKKVNTLSLNPGDSVFLKRGEVWYESLLLSASGTKQQPIRIASYGDLPLEQELPEPVISCSRNITKLLWQGVLANGGFEILQQQSEAAHLDCYCQQSGALTKARCSKKTNVFAAWHATGSGDIVVAPDSVTSWQGQSARLSSTHSYINLKSSAFSIASAGSTTVELMPRYRLSGFLRAAPGSQVEVSLMLSGSLKQYLGEDGKWHQWADKKKYLAFTYSLANDKWEPFDISFDGPVLVNDDSTFKKVLRNARLIITVRGATGVKAWVDDIRLIDTTHKQWTVNTVDNHNPTILLENGIRLAKGKDINDNGHRWFATGQKSIGYFPRNTSKITAQVELGQRRVGIRLQGTNYIVLEDIVVKGCGRSLNQSACDGAALLLASGSSNNVIRQVTTSHSDAGIRVEGKGLQGANVDNQFININSSFNRSGGIALRSYAAGNIIRNCSVHDIGMYKSDLQGQDIEPISLGGNTGIGKGNIVENCEVSNSRIEGKRPAPGVNVFNAPETIVRNNIVHDVGAYGISVAGASHDTEVYNNVVMGTGKGKQSAGGQGIYIKAARSDIYGVKIFNNTITDCTNRKAFFGGISLLGVKKCSGEDCASTEEYYQVYDAVVVNNIVHGCSGKYPFAYYAANINYISLISDYNIFYSGKLLEEKVLVLFRGDEYVKNEKISYQTWNSLFSYQSDIRNIWNRFDQNSLGVDPLLVVDEGNKGFRLGENSLAKGAGVNLNQLGIELLTELPSTSAVDIGADISITGPR